MGHLKVAPIARVAASISCSAWIKWRTSGRFANFLRVRMNSARWNPDWQQFDLAFSPATDEKWEDWSLLAPVDLVRNAIWFSIKA